jgi:hypothetical protein
MKEKNEKDKILWVNPSTHQKIKIISAIKNIPINEMIRSLIDKEYDSLSLKSNPMNNE